MVHVNSEKQEITITMPGDNSDVIALQHGLIDLLQGYDFNNQVSQSAFYSTLEMLRATLPTQD